MSKPDEWSKDGTDFSAEDSQDKIKKLLETQPVILEHRFYRGATAPARLIFDDYEELLSHLTANARPGDRFMVWGYSDLCVTGNVILDAKWPDASGNAPMSGAY
jgi:hypothetical protein